MKTMKTLRGNKDSAAKNKLLSVLPPPQPLGVFTALRVYSQESYTEHSWWNRTRHLQGQKENTASLSTVQVCTYYFFFYIRLNRCRICMGSLWWVCQTHEICYSLQNKCLTCLVKIQFWRNWTVVLKLHSLKNPSMLKKNHNLWHYLQRMMMTATTHPPFAWQVISVLTLMFIIPIYFFIPTYIFI